MKKLFIIGWSAVVTVIIGLMVLLYVSLIPHFGQIGNIMFVVLCIFLGYGTILGGVKTYSWVGIMLSERTRARNHERLVTNGEMSFYLIQAGENIYHASAEHNRALIAPPTSVVVEAEPTVTDETIIEIWNKGLSLRDIEKLTGAKYNRVQKVTSEEKKRLEKQLNG